MRANHALMIAIGIASALVVPVARSEDRPFLFVAYGQAGFAASSLADQRIDRINSQWGTAFDSWGQPTAQSLGARLLKQISPRWSVGIEGDHGRASMKRKAVVHPPDGQLLVLEQESDFADLLLVGRHSLCGSCSRFEPFVLAGAGVGYARGSTLFEANPTGPHAVYNYLRLESAGWLPVATGAVGLSTPLDDRERWSLELGAGYLWGRLRQNVQLAAASFAEIPAADRKLLTRKLVERER
jgi:hypothetical protein